MEPATAIQDIFKLSKGFDAACLDVFRFQSLNNPVYRQFLAGVKCNPEKVDSPENIPFLPVELFKTCKILADGCREQVIFASSGTTGSTQSRHFVHDLELYRLSFRKGFELAYGPPSDYCLLALLPSYLEREGSSLVVMAKELIEDTKHPLSGFYLHDKKALHQKLLQLEAAGQKTILLGVTYALLDFAEEFPMKLKNTILMETGGMKGNRKEMVREDVHTFLQDRLGLKEIHSEYGMTELLSQAYSKGNGIFQCPPWMKVIPRDTNDPLSIAKHGKTGGLNIIDLANYYSCSFIGTQDLGRVYEDGSFEVLGRFDNSDIRGCNLMVG